MLKGELFLIKEKENIFEDFNLQKITFVVCSLNKYGLFPIYGDYIDFGQDMVLNLDILVRSAIKLHKPDFSLKIKIN